MALQDEQFCFVVDLHCICTYCQIFIKMQSSAGDLMKDLIPGRGESMLMFNGDGYLSGFYKLSFDK